MPVIMTSRQLNTFPILKDLQNAPIPKTLISVEADMEKPSKRALDALRYGGFTFIDRKDLKALILNNNKIKTIEELHQLTQLNSLVLSHNEIKRLDLENLHNLSKLSLSNNKFKEIPSLQNLKKLKELRMNGNRIPCVPSNIGNCRSLKIVDLGKNKIADFKDIDALRNVPFLENLNLMGNDICSLPGYKLKIQQLIPSLKILDGRRINRFDDLLSKEASQIKDTVTKKPVEDFSVNQSDPVTLEIRQKSKDPKLSSDNPESVHSSKKKKKKEKEKEEISEIDKEESFTEENLGFSVQNNLQTETKVAEKTHRGFRSTVIELHISEKDVRHDLNPLGENRSKRKKRNKSEKTVNDNTTPSSFISDNRGLSASSHCDAKLSINSNLPKDSEAAPKIKRKKSKRSDKETDESGVNKVSDVVEDCSKVEFRNTSEIEDKIISDLTSKRKKEKSLTGANSVGKKTKKDKKKLKHKESSFELAEGSKKRKLDSKHSRKLNKRTGVIKIETVKRKRKKEPNRSSDTGVGVLSSLHVDKHEFGEGSQISW